MKRISEIIRPFSTIVFGALFFLMYFNYLQLQGEALAIGIVATVISVYYLAAGILGFILGEKLPSGLKKVLDLITLSAFPLFFFVLCLLTTIEIHQYFGPAGWLLIILSMIGSLSFSVFSVIARLVNKPLLVRIAYLFASIFTLVLLSNLLFEFDGTPTQIGDVVIVELAVYALFVSIMFGSIRKEEKVSE